MHEPRTLPPAGELRPIFAANGIHLADGPRDVAVLSPEQLILLGALRRRPLIDPGAALGLPPARAARRTPAQRAALSRTLRRLAACGLTTARQAAAPLQITPLGEAYAALLLPLIARQAARGAPYPWVRLVADSLAITGGG